MNYEITNENNAVEISVIVPLYNCSSSIKILVERLLKVFEKLKVTSEIILINDASPQNDWDLVCELASENKLVKGINLSRNFGQHYAINAGLEYKTGIWIIVMDGDLQDQPEEIEKLYEKAKEGYDIVLAKRVVRKDHFIKKSFSYLFYKLFGYLTDTKYDNTVANFGIYHYKAIDSVLMMKDRNRVFPILIQWVGFKKASIHINHSVRLKGKSSYTIKTLMKLATEMIISFSNKPLILTIKLGVTISLFSFIIGLVYLFKYFNGQISVDGYASLIISIWFLSGVIIFSIGILGIYIGKIFNATKDRPNFIIKNKINLNEV